MKPKLITAALVLLMTSGTAHAFTEEQIKVIKIVELAWSAGDGRCPRFQNDRQRMNDELKEAGITEEDFLDEYVEGDDYMPQYNKNSSAFCQMAWKLLGPNGTYKRQMLEAK